MSVSGNEVAWTRTYAIARFPSPLNYQTIELYHDDRMDYEYHIIIGSSYHCASVCCSCNAEGPRLIHPLINSPLWVDVINNGTHNMRPYQDTLFYNVFIVNHTHITVKVYKGGTPNTNTWTIDNYDKFYSSSVYVQEIHQNDTELISALRNADIRMHIKDAGHNAWIEMEY